MAIVSALIKASIDPVEISLTPGCKIKSIPKKPSVNAIIRRIRIVSPSTRAAAKVAKSGAVKLSAVASARGIIVIAVKPAAIPETLINALTPYNFFLVLRKMVKPFFAINGIKNDLNDSWHSSKLLFDSEVDYEWWSADFMLDSIDTNLN